MRPQDKFKEALLSGPASAGLAPGGETFFKCAPSGPHLPPPGPGPCLGEVETESQGLRKGGS